MMRLKAKILLLHLICVTSGISYNSEIETSKVNQFEEAKSYRLPNDTIPIRYDLSIRTKVGRDDFNFHGRAKIHVKVVEQTNVVTLHCRKIVIDKIDLLHLNESTRENLSFSLEPELDFLRISLPNAMVEGDRFILNIKYSGVLNEENFGFYRSKSSNKQNETIWIATTHFEPTNARLAIPCYDEPGIRAVIGLSIEHDQSFHAISNMPIDSIEQSREIDFVSTKFQDTPKMQIYLLAFVISDFKFVSNNDLLIEQRVYAQPNTIDSGRAGNMLNAVGPKLTQLEEHLSVSYPLPKLDHVAIMDLFEFATAMENFGLITYREKNLFDNPNSKISPLTALARKQTLAHEIAHQWFGNLVSPKWWSYSWLNEGFAKFFGYYIASLIWPNENHMKFFKGFTRNEAFSNGFKKLNFHVDSPAEIEGNFNHHMYGKGASVVLMFQEALTVATFTKGLTYYLTKLRFEAASPEDLHRNLQKAYDEDFPGSPLNIGEVMTTWEDQDGYPIVTARKEGNEIILRQYGSRRGRELFAIPISYATKSSPNFDEKTPKFWMTEKFAVISNIAEGDWIILNVQLTGFYKVEYDKRIQELIFEDLRKNPKLLPTWHKTQLFESLSSSYDVNQNFDITIVFEALKLLSTDESDSMFWRQAQAMVRELSARFKGTRIMEKYQNFIEQLVQPHLNRLGYENVAEDTWEDLILRKILISLRCNEECSRAMVNQLLRYFETREKPVDFCVAVRSADESTQKKIFEIIMQHNAIKELDIFRCSSNENLLRKFLAAIIHNAIDMSDDTREKHLHYTASKSEEGFDVVLEFVLSDFKTIEKFAAERSMKNFIRRLVLKINTKAQLLKLKNVLKVLQAENHFTVSVVDKIIAEVERRLEMLSFQVFYVEPWLDNNAINDV